MPQDKALAQLNRQTLNLGKYQTFVGNRLNSWWTTGFPRRLWAKDPTLWLSRLSSEISDHMGWLTLPDAMREQLEGLVSFAEEVKADGVHYVVLLGMGGSSLAPEVFYNILGNAPGYPELIILDSTHPEAVRAVEDRITLRETLFLVSSESGTTVETLSFFRYFWQKVCAVDSAPGRHFVAITNPSSSLDQLAHERAFRRVFLAPADVGGRYSALTFFGLLPVALMGMNPKNVLAQARMMSENCALGIFPDETPCLVLGAALGELATRGRDKVTFLASKSIKSFPVWLEQLIAESTGKDEKGIVPVVNETPALAETYGEDRLFVYFANKGKDDVELEELLRALAVAGHPTIRIDMNEKESVGQEIFRWEMAVAAAGSVLEINPFNQPDVEMAKELARQMMNKLTERTEVEGDMETVSAEDHGTLSKALDNFLTKGRRGDYVAIQAYLQPRPKATESLQAMRLRLVNRLGLATTLGYGPRFLHSTGQLHKGGPNTCLFIQLVDESRLDLKIPETDYSFGDLIRAQALGDYHALKQCGRRVLRINLKGDVIGGLARLIESI